MRVERIAAHLVPLAVTAIAIYMAVILVRGIVEWFA